MTADPFHSSKRSIERANYHLNDLKRQSTEFFKTEPYETLVECEPDTGEHTYKVKLVKPMPPSLETIAADAVNNLRSALDQACYAFRTTKGRYTYFPFSDSATNFEPTLKGRCKTFPQEIIDLIRRLKPYKGGDDLLWALNELCNTNKHGVLAPIAVCTSLVNFRNIEIKETGGFQLFAPRWDRTKNEMVFFRCVEGSTVEANIDFATHIVICDVLIVDGQPIEAVLHALINKVHGIVMAIEAEARRIGFFQTV